MPDLSDKPWGLPRQRSWQSISVYAVTFRTNSCCYETFKHPSSHVSGSVILGEAYHFAPGQSSIMRPLYN